LIKAKNKLEKYFRYIGSGDGKVTMDCSRLLPPKKASHLKFEINLMKNNIFFQETRNFISWQNTFHIFSVLSWKTSITEPDMPSTSHSQ